MAKIKQNNYVLFFYNDSKKWLAKISKNEQLHTHIGVIKHSDAIGKEYGSRLVTNKDKYVYLFEPTIHDFVMKIQHGTQIVYPKDLGYIVARTGLTSGQKVVEIGTARGFGLAPGQQQKTHATDTHDPRVHQHHFSPWYITRVRSWWRQRRTSVHKIVNLSGRVRE